MRVATVPMQGWLATPTRRNALKGIFIAPALFMLGVAVQSKPNYVDFDNMIGDKEAEARITNYVPVVREAEWATRPRPPRADDLRKAASMWIAATDAGKLQPLPQLSPEDVMQNGVKGQILSAARELSRSLLRRGEAEVARRDYLQASKDFTAGLRVLESIKYSDLASIAIVGNAQRRLLTRLAAVAKHLPADERQKVRTALAHSAPQPKLFESAVKNDKRIAFIAQAQASEMARATGKHYEPTLDVNKDISMLHNLAQHSEKENEALVQRL